MYTASYAALPHIVAVAATHPARDRIVCLCLAGSIKAGRHTVRRPGREAPDIPPDLAKAYDAALRHAADLILDCLQVDWSEENYKILFGALAVVRGQPALGEAITSLERELSCPECRAVFVTPGYDCFEPVVLKEEGIHQYIDDEPAYREWVAQHPLGLVFFVPCDKLPESIVLHRATCPAIQREDAQVYLTVCVPDFTRLMIWQSQYGFHSSIRHCRICKPGS